jgi:hypothetical protein
MDKFPFRLSISLSGLALALLVPVGGLHAQSAVNASQKATAEKVASAGVPLSALAADAPNAYTVKAGDTLWSVATLFLKSPWRWPELWGMNMADIRNPHRIKPGQVLVLDKSREMAVLRLRQQEASDMAGIPLVKVTPQTRYEAVADTSIPTLKPHLVEPFLVAPLVLDQDSLDRAPRVVSGQDERVLLSKGDRAYAMSVYQDDSRAPQLVLGSGKSRQLRVFRNATALKDPGTGEVLGYEAQHVGSARLVRSESVGQEVTASGERVSKRVPATIDIVDTREEIRDGDRLLPESERSFQGYVPHAPQKAVQAQIVSVYGGSAVNYVAQSQVVTINRGVRDGMEVGHVLAILRNQGKITDKTDPDQPDLTLPSERAGLLMVFRTFDRLSYALVLEINDGVQVGDHLSNP